MKKSGKHIKIWGNLLMLSVFCSCLLSGARSGRAAEKKKEVDVLFTHDMHSHLNSLFSTSDGKQENIGGYARIQTIIDRQRKKNPDTLVVDGGDFSMGTLFQTIYESEASELRMLGYLGYDVATLGNHEFDYRTDGLCNMLQTAKESGDVLPQMLLCNVDWSEPDDEQQKLKEVLENYGVKNYTVVEKNGVRIAILGVFGKDSLACAPTCVLKFKDPVDAVKETVAEIQKNEDVDMIVALSHSGTDPNPKKSEDEILAKEVPELDLIISGHTHTVLEEPVICGNTAIVSCGEYGKRVGSLSMVKNDEGRWDVKSYKLIPVTEDIPSDTGAQAKIDAFEAVIDKQYLEQFGYKADQVLAHNSLEFSSLEDVTRVHTEHNLGDFMADAYVYAVENAKDYDGVPVDVTVVPSGCIRGTYAKGDITVSDVFDSFSLGIGPDGVPGYPLVSVYLTGEELKTLAEMDASVSDYMMTARLYLSGLNFTYNPNRMVLNKVTDVYLERGSSSREIEDDKLYRVVSDLYSGQMLGAVTEKSKRILSVVPKDADGTPVENLENCIIYENGAEMKAWVAMAEYMGSFPENEEGIAEIPVYYGSHHDRKVVDDSKDLANRIKSPNKYAVMISGAVFAAFLVIAGLICFIIVKIRKIGRRRN